ncbi:MAG: excinuclease ABC subunit UvrA [Nitrospinae bacterium]|nr:excinuclease ABC subunit UvrA [Nitrospinota bacterium]
MQLNEIVIKGAREHNLKNINLRLPRNKLIVVTGPSGSGKSSLAFDTIYAEGQRRYVESLSAYARQFLEQMSKPEVDQIDGLSPAISIEQKTTTKNPRSTVGTVTEIYDYLRLLYARVGRVNCYQCGREISSQTVQQIVDQVDSLPEGSKLQILSPIVRGRKGEYKKVLENFRKKGFVRVRINGDILDLSETVDLDKNKKHYIELVVDRLVAREGIKKRMADSVELALRHSEGLVSILMEDGSERIFSENFACIDCGVSYPELTPRMFSFNSPHGACPECSGLGIKKIVDQELVILDHSLSLAEGAIRPWNPKTSPFIQHALEALAEHYKFSLDAPFKDLGDKIRQVLLFGSGEEQIEFFYYRNNKKYEYIKEFDGVLPSMEKRHKEADSQYAREEIEQYMSAQPCHACKGARLKKESLSVRVGGLKIIEATSMSVKEAIAFFRNLKLTGQEMIIAGRILKEIEERLGFLRDVGLDYLALDRPSSTLSGGEGQRIRLATQIGSALVGVLYILDEPSIGLHQKDNQRLLATLIRLRDIGNTVIVVEHDPETMLAADHIVDLGPGAGVHGGEVVAEGTPESLLRNPNSVTGKYLSGQLRIETPKQRRKGMGRFLEIKGAAHNNLKGIDVKIPLGAFTCVTGVSGSGKSTLVIDILYKSMLKKIWNSREKAGRHGGIFGAEFIDKVIDINQSPIGRTPRSNPATYTGLFTAARELFAQVPESRKRGYKTGRFSFNVKGGRCEACSGDGAIKIEMHFLPDIYVTCEVCKGRRFDRETLDVLYKGKNIADVLDMTAEEALAFFDNVPALKEKLKIINEVGLSYIKLGQSATTLSGGEAQRVKLAKELSRRSTGRTLYILDEPTTGLHFADIAHLLAVLNRLTDAGNTIVVIEHNLDIIKSADYVIDLGPEGGDDGGRILAEGTPEQVAGNHSSYTGQYLRKVLI